MTTELAAWLTATRAEAAQYATVSQEHRVEAERLMADSARLFAMSMRLDADDDALDKARDLHWQGVAEHGIANAYAQRALMLRAKADRIEADTIKG